MGRLLKLECFDIDPSSGVSAIVLPPDKLEEERLAAFDNGYKAGWDDAARAHTEQQATISQDLAENLQHLSFTYHDARNAVLSEMEGILRGTVEKILPEAIWPSLGEMIIARLVALSEMVSEPPAKIIVSPADAGRLKELMAGKVAPPHFVEEEPTLASGQAYLRMGPHEEKLDLETTLSDIANAVSDFFATHETEGTLNHA